MIADSHFNIPQGSVWINMLTITMTVADHKAMNISWELIYEGTQVGVRSPNNRGPWNSTPGRARSARDAQQYFFFSVGQTLYKSLSVSSTTAQCTSWRCDQTTWPQRKLSSTITHLQQHSGCQLGQDMAEVWFGHIVQEAKKSSWMGDIVVINQETLDENPDGVKSCGNVGTIYLAVLPLGG